MKHLPIFLDLAGRTALVLGEGATADRKAAALQEAGATVRRAARFGPELLDGIALAYGADAAEADLAALSAAAQRLGIPVNVVDRPELCSFITPAIVDRAPVTIAISTGGAAPVLARLLRAKIEQVIPPAYGALAALAAKFQARARALWPEPAARRQILEAALTGEPAALLFANQADAAEAAFARVLQAAPPQGRVALVGAGPGAADLLTLRAHRLLTEADVIVHDRLAGEEVLTLARRDAERIDVGKTRARHCLKQDEINALLVRLAQSGKTVVRLKGGDPFVFGRGGEELEALIAAGIPCEIVPGVTAALAAAAGAGIPLTHRGESRALLFITGHTSNHRLELDFAQLAQFEGTIAVYMGIVTLPQLQHGLLSHGMNPDLPAAIVENAGRTSQRTLHATLATLHDKTPSLGTGPALVLLGPALAHGTKAGLGSTPDAGARERGPTPRLPSQL